MSKIIRRYRVYADRQTGEWIAKPVLVGMTTHEKWSMKEDSDDLHYDTFIDPDGESSAVVVRWTD